MIPQDHVDDLQISHHTGALSFTSLAHIVVLTAVQRLIRLNHTAKTKMPVFHDLLNIWNSGMRERAQAMKFAMGTSGYIGSIVLEKLIQNLEANVFLNLKLDGAKRKEQILMRTLDLKLFYL